MSTSYVRPVHIAALTALIAFSLTSIGFQYFAPYPDELLNYKIFMMANSALIAVLIGVRLRQVVAGNVSPQPDSGVERAAVNAGIALIAIGIVGTLVAKFRSFFGSGTSLLNAAFLSSLWIGTALIELVIANARAGAAPEAGSSAGGKLVIAVLMLIVGFVLGVLALLAFLAFGWLI